MKAVILCGGKGTRLAEETEYKPKPLVKIGGRPILWHILKLYSHQGVKEFILCLGYKSEMIKEYFLNLEEMSNDFVLDLRRNKTYQLSDPEEGLDIKIIFADTGEDSMTGARIAKIKKYIGDDEEFLLTYGDGVADISLKKLYEHHKKCGKVATITAVNPTYRFGLIGTKDGIVNSFDEKPEMKDFINGGFMVFNRRIFDYLSTDKNCVLEEEPLCKLAKEGELASYHHDGYWQCMDNQKDVNSLNNTWADGAPWAIWLKQPERRFLEENCFQELVSSPDKDNFDEGETLNEVPDQNE